MVIAGSMAARVGAAGFGDGICVQDRVLDRSRSVPIGSRRELYIGLRFYVRWLATSHCVSLILRIVLSSPLD